MLTPATTAVKEMPMLATRRPCLIAGLFAVVMTIAPIAHAAAADLAGVWKGTMETQIGPAETTITIDPGAALAGKLRTEPSVPVHLGTTGCRPSGGIRAHLAGLRSPASINHGV
jgi:hypothetical protein